MNDDQYQPISCSAYDLYEIAIMRNQQLNLSWWEGASDRRSAVVKPIGLRVRDGAEYLVVRLHPGDTDSLEIRLDRVISSSIKGP